MASEDRRLPKKLSQRFGVSSRRERAKSGDREVKFGQGQALLRGETRDPASCKVVEAAG